MRPELKRMNERLAYFLKQMDLDNAHIRHAEERIEELEKELKDRITLDNVRLVKIKELEAEYTVLKDKNFWLNQSIQAENDRLERNEKLEKENEDLRFQLQDLKHKWDVSLATFESNSNLVFELNSKNNKLANELVELQQDNKDLEQAYSTLKEEYHELVLKYEETQRIEGHHYCDCGAVAYIHYQIGAGKHYCGQCFKREVIKL